MAVISPGREASSDSEAACRIQGSLTITRAASVQREIDALPDPLTIDLSRVERMDTVGAWIVYRATRDRQAQVVGANPEAQSLIDQVGEFDKPVRVRPHEGAVSPAA